MSACDSPRSTIGVATANNIRTAMEAFREANITDIRFLQSILPYIYNVSKDYEGKGRARIGHLALVCWHGLSVHAYKHLSELIISEAQLRRDRRTEGIDLRTKAGSQEYHHWCYSKVRGTFEKLLGALVLPASSSLAQAAQAQFAYTHEAEALEVLQPDANETVPWMTPLFDQSGFAYTVFQALPLDQQSFLRTRAMPPLFNERNLDSEIPLILQLLHFAWMCLVARTPSRAHARPEWLSSLANLAPLDSAFSPEVSGLNYGVTGHVVINWTRFMASPLYTAFRARCDQSQNMKALADLKTPESVQQALVRALHTYKINKVLVAFETQKERFLREAMFSDIVTLPVTVQMLFHEESCKRSTSRLAHFTNQELSNVSEPLEEHLTIFDPLMLQARARVFDPSWCAKQERQRIARNVQRQMRAAATSPTAEAVGLGVTAHVYRFQFKPMEYIASDIPVWFPKDHVETIFATKKKDQLYFTRPGLLSQAKQACPSEIEAWTRTLDFLRVTESFYEHGDLSHLAEIKETAKSGFFQNARAAFLEKVARDFIPEFISLEASGYREIQRIKAKARQVYMRDNPDALNSKRWYYDLILKQARPHTDITQVRRVARVLIPELNIAGDVQPKNVHFYSRLAIKTFLSIATRTVMGESTAVGESNTTLATLTNALGAAPYVTAWAKFCLDMQEHGVEFSEDAYLQKTHWSPLEDFILFQSYSKFPRMTAQEWGDLLTQLPNRDAAACRSRINIVNNVLIRVLTKSRLEKYKIGNMKGDPFRAKRAVFLYALATSGKLESSKDYVLTQVVQKLTPDRLERIKLPGTYRGSFFTTFAF